MRLFACVDHDCHYPVGGASVVVAVDEPHARQLLDAELGRHGLKGHDDDPYTLREIDVTKPSAAVLRDGDY